MKASDIGIPTRVALALVLVVLSPTFALFTICICWIAALAVVLGRGDVEIGGSGAVRADDERDDEP